MMPKAAVRGTGEQTFVWTIRNEHIARVPVRVGESIGDTLQILSGLDGGETVVLSGPEDLREGMLVQVADQ
jgi:multidrug efflux pump subunit AcrA (membrane-fusion protein)